MNKKSAANDYTGKEAISMSYAEKIEAFNRLVRFWFLSDLGLSYEESCFMARLKIEEMQSSIT